MYPGAMGIIEEGIQSQLRTRRYLETINDSCRSIDHDVHMCLQGCRGNAMPIGSGIWKLGWYVGH